MSKVSGKTIQSGHCNGQSSTGTRTSRIMDSASQQRKTEIKKTFNISVFGFDKIQNTAHGLYKRVVWFLAMFVCIVVCTWQLYDRIEYYLSHPTAVQVTLNRTCNVQFPVFILCPARSPFELSVVFGEANKTFCKNNPEKCNNTTTVPFGELNITLDKLWDEFSVETEDVKVWSGCSSQMKPEKCNNDLSKTLHIKKEQFDTVVGRCVKVSVEEPSLYRGTDTFIELMMLHKQYHEERVQLMVAAEYIFLAREGANKVCGFILREELPMYHVTTLRLQRKMFRVLNRPRQPCVDNLKFNECIERCLDEKLEHTVNCSLPFINSSKLNPCSNYYESTTAHEMALKLFMTTNPYTCTCNPLCEETIYSAQIAPARNTTDDSHTTLWVQFADDLLQSAIEVETYKGGDLLSDVGGSLGFILGICVLHILEVVDELFQKGVEFVRIYCFNGSKKEQTSTFTSCNCQSSSSFRKPIVEVNPMELEITTIGTDRLVSIKRKSVP